MSDRERERLGAALFVRDEIADREAALLAARTTLGEKAIEVVATARGLGLHALVSELR